MNKPFKIIAIIIFATLAGVTVADLNVDRGKPAALKVYE